MSTAAMSLVSTNAWAIEYDLVSTLGRAAELLKTLREHRQALKVLTLVRTLNRMLEELESKLHGSLDDMRRGIVLPETASPESIKEAVVTARKLQVFVVRIYHALRTTGYTRFWVTKSAAARLRDNVEMLIDLVDWFDDVVNHQQEIVDILNRGDEQARLGNTVRLVDIA
jgi:hypothetical protein